MTIIRKAGSILLGLVLLAIIFLAKDGDVRSLMRDLGLEGLMQGAPPAGGAPLPAAAAPQAGTMIAKLEPFIICINRVDSAMRSNYSDYRRSFPAAMDGGPIFHRSFKIVPYEVDNNFSRECAAGLLKARDTAPADAGLDDAAQEYANTLTELIPLMNSADDYLRQENYRDDGWRTMRDLHPRLAGLFEKFLAASDRMRAAVETANLRAAEERLADIEKENGRDYRWHQTNLMHQSRLALNRLEPKADGTLPDAATITASEQSFAGALEAARAWMAQNPDARTPGGNRPVLTYIESRAADYLTAIRTLRRDLAEGRTEKTGENLGRVTASFNSLVDDYNIRIKNGH